MLVARRLGAALRDWRHLDRLFRATPEEVPARALIAQKRAAAQRKYRQIFNEIQQFEPKPSPVAVLANDDRGLLDVDLLGDMELG